MVGPNENTEQNYIDVPTLAETFADGVQMIGVDGTVVRLTLTVSRPAPSTSGRPPEQAKATALRLVMPTPSFLELFRQMEQIVSQLEKRGVIRRGNQPE